MHACEFLEVNDAASMTSEFDRANTLTKQKQIFFGYMQLKVEKQNT